MPRTWPPCLAGTSSHTPALARALVHDGTPGTPSAAWKVATCCTELRALEDERREGGGNRARAVVNDRHLCRGGRPRGTGNRCADVEITSNLGYGEVGVYGGGITRGAPTPRIDQLAAEGTRLTNFNVEAQCTPSRSSFLTGRFSMRSGTHSIPIGGGLDGLTRWEVILAETLSEAGYATAAFGKWHLGSAQGRLPNDQGFDE